MIEVMSALLLLILLPQVDPGALIEKLRSETVEERDEAARKLKALGTLALPALDRAATDKDPEVSSRATQLARVIRTIDLLTVNLMKEVPGIEERLAKGD